MSIPGWPRRLPISRSFRSVPRRCRCHVSALSFRQIRRQRRSRSSGRYQAPEGAPDVGIMVIDGTGGRKGRPVYLHMHGGGYVSGRVEGRAANCQVIAEACEGLVVSVDYRLAPETVFPGSLEDNYAVLRWLNDNADALGIDPARIAVGGESAGGGHAAMLAIAARDRGEFEIAFQLLIYPMIDDRTGSTVAMPPHIGRYVWPPASNGFGWGAFLGQAAGLEFVPPGSVPARIADLSGLPPALRRRRRARSVYRRGRRICAPPECCRGADRTSSSSPARFTALRRSSPDAPVSIRFRAAALDALKRGLGL